MLKPISQVPVTDQFSSRLIQRANYFDIFVEPCPLTVLGSKSALKTETIKTLVSLISKRSRILRESNQIQSKIDDTFVNKDFDRIQSDIRKIYKKSGIYALKGTSENLGKEICRRSRFDGSFWIGHEIPLEQARWLGYNVSLPSNVQIAGREQDMTETNIGNVFFALIDFVKTKEKVDKKFNQLQDWSWMKQSFKKCSSSTKESHKWIEESFNKFNFSKQTLQNSNQFSVEALEKELKAEILQKFGLRKIFEDNLDLAGDWFQEYKSFIKRIGLASDLAKKITDQGEFLLLTEALEMREKSRGYQDRQQEIKNNPIRAEEIGVGVVRLEELEEELEEKGLPPGKKLRDSLDNLGISVEASLSAKSMKDEQVSALLKEKADIIEKINRCTKRKVKNEKALQEWAKTTPSYDTRLTEIRELFKKDPKEAENKSLLNEKADILKKLNQNKKYKQNSLKLDQEIGVWSTRLEAIEQELTQLSAESKREILAAATHLKLEKENDTILEKINKDPELSPRMQQAPATKNDIELAEIIKSVNMNVLEEIEKLTALVKIFIKNEKFVKAMKDVKLFASFDKGVKY